MSLFKLRMLFQNKKHFLFLILTFTTLYSCDCHYQLSGVVVDSKTKDVLENVSIGKTDSTDLDNPFNRKSYTNSKGKFSISGVSGQCKVNKLYFSHQYYQTEKLTLPNHFSDTIYLSPKISSIGSVELISKKHIIDTIIVEHLGLNCFCPNWMETKHRQLDTSETNVAISLLPNIGSKLIIEDSTIWKQTPLLLQLTGRYFKEEKTHRLEEKTYSSKTFQYDTYQIIEQ